VIRIERIGSRIFILVCLAALTAGCATRATGPPPEWIRESSRRDDRGERIIAYGNGVNAAEADALLERDVRSQVVRVLVEELTERGVVIDDTVAEIAEEVAEERSRTLTGDRFDREAEGDRDESFLLVLYATDLIERDLATVERRAGALRTDAGALGRRSWDRIEAILRSEPPEDLEQKRAFLAEAIDAVQQVTVSLIASADEVALGASDEFRLSYQFAFSPPDATGYRTRFRLIETGPVFDGDRRERSEVIEVEEGVVDTISVAPPDIIGAWRYLIEPSWLQDALDRWNAAIGAEEERERTVLENRVEEIADALRAGVTIAVTSEATTIPTVVIILDRDIAGNPISGNVAARNAIRVLEEAGFDVRSVQLDDARRRMLAERSSRGVADLYDILPFDVLSSVDRAMIGWADIVSFDESESYRVEVSIDASVFDLRKDRVLARVSLEERTAGGDAQSAIRAAFVTAGRRAAELIAPRLP
jgi:hypothetical protein